MTKKEGAIISAYTGIMVGSFSDLHEYAEKKLNRPVFTHEFASKSVNTQLKQAAEKDFIRLCENIK